MTSIPQTKGLKDIAGFDAMSHDILINLLKESDNPYTMNTYLTHHLRELTGAGIVILTQCLHCFGGEGHRMVSINPERRKALAESAEFNRLLNIVDYITETQLWEPGSKKGRAEEILSSLSLGLSMAVPISTENIRVGHMFLLNLPDKNNITQVVKILELLSTIVALVFRNSLTFERQERIIAERTSQLKESETLYKTIVESEPECVKTVAPDGTLLDMNPAGLAMVGADSKEEVIGKPIYPLIRKEHRSAFRRLLKGVLKGESGVLTFEIQGIKGVKRWLESHAVPFFDVNGKVSAMLAVTRDITEHKKAEESLKESEEKYRGIFDESVAAVYVFDGNKNFIDSNQAGLELLGYSKEELLSMSIPDVDADPVVVLPAHEQLLSGERIINYEHKLKRKDGTIITVLNNSRPLTDIEGNMIGMQSTLIDITERKGAENKIKASLKEKEVLLREIHHRVKNNLQIISSLLSLQSRHTRDEGVINVLKDSQNRIASMAMIHEKLYTKRDFANIDFSDYIKDLITSLYRTYGVNSEKVLLEMDVKDISLGLDTAIPCGLIINELISNSLKHAFYDCAEGRIKISLKKKGRDEVELVVSDNGTGFPEGLDPDSTETLGLHLVKILVEDQLKGRLRFERKNGTVFKIRFQEKA